MSRTRVILLSLVLMVTAGRAGAYVEILHARMSQHAFDRAASETDFMKRYGFAPIALVLRNEIAYGAIHEDDGYRSVNHFYDPTSANAALTIYWPLTLPQCKTVGDTAPNWALNIEDNEYGLAAAHDALYRNLAGKTPVDRVQGAHDLFVDLGHMVHLLQDMAQPEHTRNDQHLSKWGYGLTGFPIKAAASLYENWTRDHVANADLLPNGASTDEMLEGYPTVSPSRRSYGGHFLLMAEYSNNNHVTQDTNYGDPMHCVTNPRPQLSDAIPRTEPYTFTITDPLFLTTTQVTVAETIYSTKFFDYNAGQYDNDGFHDIESFVNHETKKYDPNVKVFSLDDPSWLTRSANLLPKAVGYSAGFIERFFRSRTHTFWTYDAATNSFVVTPRDFGTEDRLTNCTAEVYRTNDLGQLELLSSSGPLSQCTFFKIASIPYDAASPIWLQELRVVMRGKLGDEVGAVTGEIIHKKHTLNLVMEYQSGIAWNWAGFQIIKQGKDAEECAGCSMIVAEQQGGSWVSSGIPFGIPLLSTVTKTASGTMGADDSDEYFAQVATIPQTDFSTSKVVKLTLYRDSMKVGELTLTGQNYIQQGVSFTGAGALHLSP